MYTNKILLYHKNIEPRSLSSILFYFFPLVIPTVLFNLTFRSEVTPIFQTDTVQKEVLIIYIKKSIVKNYRKRRLIKTVAVGTDRGFRYGACSEQLWVSDINLLPILHH